MSKKIAKTFSLSENTVEVLKQLESFSFYNVSKFADSVLREKGLDVLAILKTQQDLDIIQMQKNWRLKKLKTYPKVNLSKYWGSFSLQVPMQPLELLLRLLTILWLKLYQANNINPLRAAWAASGWMFIHLL